MPRTKKSEAAQAADKTVTETANETTLAAEPVAEKPRTRRSKATRTVQPQVLTIEQRGEAELPQTQEEILWHELTNAYMTHKILSGVVGGVERTANGGLAIIYYKDARVAIPLTEMLAEVNEEGTPYAGQSQRLERLVNNMMNCEVDFVIRGLDVPSRSVVASRKDAMLRKQHTFYMTPAADGRPQIYEGRIVQARVVAVSEKSIRIEVFGAECTVLARDLAWEWICDAHDQYHVGDVILVRVNSIDLTNPQHLRIQADPRSVTENSVADRLAQCKEQSRYAGTVTDVRKGIIYIRLYNGINAIAHNCLDTRMPAKKDQVSYVITHINREQNVAVGIITRIIRQNL